MKQIFRTAVCLLCLCLLCGCTPQADTPSSFAQEELHLYDYEQTPRHLGISETETQPEPY